MYKNYKRSTMNSEHSEDKMFEMVLLCTIMRLQTFIQAARAAAQIAADADDNDRHNENNGANHNADDGGDGESDGGTVFLVTVIATVVVAVTEHVVVDASSVAAFKLVMATTTWQNGTKKCIYCIQETRYSTPPA